MTFPVYAASWLLLTTAPCLAARSGVPEQLTGNSSRAWVVERSEPSRVQGLACAVEDTYTFTINHELDVNRCESGHMRPRRYTWSVKQAANGPVLAVAGAGEYALSFERYPPAPRRLRLQPLGTGPAADLVLQSNED